ncbi:FAD-binding oxidoreductase [Georgenia yuyongxinii]|uniref:FAD-binding oxidoreductase n=1 Tax=Georgenia yuyongxinii TaxID=2589797 RepID=A0A552WVY0_9MICO|nr:FAD-binding oxidoreductase [Georgenia yuyongxinii]TRW46729.1 FAD-binding oxidoreductase [Georgenia yuyongxinii]
MTVPLLLAGTTRRGTRELRSFSRSVTARSELARPAGDREWEAILAAAGARGVTVRGAGASYGDAALNSGGLVALTSADREIGPIDTERRIVDVDAGATLGHVLARVLAEGWTLPVVPGTATVTVGGAVAADVHGKNHPTRSSIGAHIESLDLVTPADGLLTVSPSIRPETFWATVGGLGLTGIVRRVRLRVEPTSGWCWSVDRAAGDLAAVLERLATSADSHAVAWLDGHATGTALGRGVITTTRAAAPHDLPSHPPAAVRPRTGAGRGAVARNRAPRLPGLLTPGVVRAANTARFALARARGERPSLTAVARSLFPLDALPGWPALYGGRGFLQHQTAVPYGEEEVLAVALRALQGAGHPPVLAVLKRLGAPPPGQAPGSLSFPLPGWTLALDLPVPRAGADAAWLGRTLDDLDELVADAGGRVNLVKDARLRPELVRHMYQGLDCWREERGRLDPDGVMTSDLARRLGLGPRGGAL